MISREKALELVKSNVSNKNLVKHMLACEVCMRELAKYFGENEEEWAIAGLLHDLDYPHTADKPEKHAYITVEMLENEDVNDNIKNAILAHPGHKERETLMEKTLYAVDPLTGLIVAAVLMHPTKKIANIDKNFVMRRYKEKRFAAGANREQIASIKEAGLELEDFIDKCIKAMQLIDKELGL